MPTSDSLSTVQPSPGRNIVTAGETGAGIVGQGIENLGTGIVRATTEIQSADQQQQRQQDALDLIRAEAAQKNSLFQIEQQFKNDGDYPTYDERFTPQAQAATDNASSLIANPQMREKWRLKADSDILASRERLIRRSDTMAQQDRQNALEDALKNHLDIMADPNSSDEDRAQAGSDMRTAIDLARHANILTLKAAYKLQERYTQAGDEAAVRGRLSRGDDPEAIINDLNGGKPATTMPKAGANPDKPTPVPTTTIDPQTGEIIPALAPATQISGPLETGHADPLKGIANISRDSGGSKSYGNFGLNSGGSMQKFVSTFGDGFGLTAKPGTKEFDDQWKNAAGAAPVELHDAEMQWWDKNISSKVTNALVDVGVDPNIAADPRVKAYFADRSVQYGEASIKKHGDRIAEAASSAGDDPVAFLQAMSESDKAKIPGDFQTAIETVPQNDADRQRYVGGLENRVANRESAALGAPRGSGPYPNLSPQQRSRLTNVVKVAARDDTLQSLKDSETEILRTGEAPKDDKGRTALQRAKFSLTENQLSKAVISWDTAVATHAAVAPLPNMTVSEARDHIDNLNPDHNANVEHYAIADKVQKAAQAAWNKIENLRESDPATAVDDAPEVQQVRQSLKDAGVSGPSTSGNEKLIEARLAAQTRLQIPPYQQRMLTSHEATDLLRLPPRPDSPDEVEAAIKEADGRAKQIYGKYADDALDAAINLRLKTAATRTSAHDLVAGFRAESAPKPDPGKSWMDVVKGLFTPADSSKQPTKGEPQAAVPGTASTPVPNENQINWVIADPGARQADFDAKFGPGSFAKIMAMRGKGAQ